MVCDVTQAASISVAAWALVLRSDCRAIATPSAASLVSCGTRASCAYCRHASAGSKMSATRSSQALVAGVVQLGVVKQRTQTQQPHLVGLVRLLRVAWLWLCCVTTQQEQQAWTLEISQ